MWNNFITIALFLTSAVTLVTSNPTNPVCGTCNPVSGLNHCDPTTSCINTGAHFHCACRAGYKASKENNNVNKQFRLTMPNYGFLVFTPENTVCNTLCDNPYGGVGTLCTEVPTYSGPGCAV
ncbi:hypothetical protein V501_05838 [Pseudogymnoascus sp. VKM F-4519 (FW-2642)]|uniref:EGF-like calcium-binding domain-containing protein n=1 Tax=Pseudogymnoascus verrucosus TaxID=342668 RepID=A0A1B8GX15_9PEZI|nr:uncharacterized protein VE01_01393 [Pseudogymnoascus verrucosus]KFY80764.1 hypothetical protein V499_00418 [Pseudogymnoascus sp. VKM F-103]KFZ08728.1 hypothetical protein V501_05838 [Pseudogymnoascus sp. VKM F-4519 (FW-2642)]OBU00374.1 hypothetical protein VE01_01393 [Pseudogymnoascus verrucosus]